MTAVRQFEKEKDRGKEKKRLAENQKQLIQGWWCMSNNLLGSAAFVKYNTVETAKLDELPLMGFGTVEDEGKTLYTASFIERHFMTIAPTRSGKGVALIIPNLLRYRGSCIVIDPKGENAWVTAKYRRENLGNKTIILDPWGEVNRRYGEKMGEKETIATFNPLSVLDPVSEHFADDVAYIADALIINEGKDPHWDNSARELVAGLISYCVESFGEAASLPMVRLLMSKPLEEISGIALDAQKFGPESVSARKLGRFVVESKEIGSIVSTALTQTAFLDSATLSKNLAASSFSFEDLIHGQATIYLVLPVDKLYTYGRWLRLMVSLGIRTVARNTEKLYGPVLFMLDEFGTIGKLSAVAQAFGLMAGLQLCLWAFVQDLNQLKRDYPDEWETFVGNCEVLTAFDVMDQFTAKHLSEMLGTRTVERITRETADLRKSEKDPNYSQITDQVFARDLMQPNEIRQTPRCLMISRKGSNLIDLAPYHKDTELLMRARELPFYPLTTDQKAAINAEKSRVQEQIKQEGMKRVAERLPNITVALHWFEHGAGLSYWRCGMLNRKYGLCGIQGEFTEREALQAIQNRLYERTKGDMVKLNEEFKKMSKI